MVSVRRRGIFSPQSVRNSSSLAALSQKKADLVVVSWFAANCLIWSHGLTYIWLRLWGSFWSCTFPETLALLVSCFQKNRVCIQFIVHPCLHGCDWELNRWDKCGLQDGLVSWRAYGQSPGGGEKNQNPKEVYIFTYIYIYFKNTLYSFAAAYGRQWSTSRATVGYK